MVAWQSQTPQHDIKNEHSPNLSNFNWKIYVSRVIHSNARIEMDIAVMSGYPDPQVLR